MRPPIVALTVAYAAGLWLGLVSHPSLPTLGVGIVVLAGALWVAGPAPWRVLLLVTGTLGIGAGMVAGRGQASWCAKRWQPGPHAALIQLHDGPAKRGTTTGDVVSAAEHCRGPLRLRFAEGSPPAGSRLSVVGTFLPTGALRIRHYRVIPGPRDWRFVLRERLLTRIDALYGTRAPLVQALVLDRKDDIDPQLKRAFADSGLAHLLAISGMHVGILLGWTMLILRTMLPPSAAWVAGTLVAWFYVALIGLPAPATRSAAVVTIACIARLRQRHPSPGVTLAVAVLLVLAIDPLAVTSIGAWLSVAAIWGSTAADADAPRGKGIVKGMLRMLIASVGATLATAPITAYVFGVVAPIAIIANLIAIPLSAIAMPGVFASLIAGNVIAGGTGLALAATEQTAILAAAVPGGHLTGPPGVGYTIPWLALLVAAVWMRRRRPTIPVTVRRGLIGAAAGSWLLVATDFASGSDARGGVAIHVLDVGQGDAIAIRTPHGRWFLIDAGPRIGLSDAGRDVVLPFLRRQGVRALDVVIPSHGDADHLGGIPSVVRSLAPPLVLENGQPVATSLYLEHQAAIDEAESEWRPARTGDTLVIDGVTLAVLHPSAQWMATRLETNENSVVLRLSYGEFDALLTGDAGLPAESVFVGKLGETDLLKVGHHGSTSATSSPLLNTTRPKAAVISVGGGNTYGHPAPSVIARLAEHRIPVYRTDRGGTVTIRSDGRTFVVEQGSRPTVLRRLSCLLTGLSRSNDSSPNASACTRAPPASFPTSSTTSPSQPRSSPATSAARD